MKRVFAGPAVRWLVLVVATGLTITGAVWAGRRQHVEELNRLEAQLALAQKDQNRPSIRELAKRLVECDGSAETRLKAAGWFLDITAMDEFWNTLALPADSTGTARAQAEYLRAKGHRTCGDLPACKTRLMNYLKFTELTREQRAGGWAELAEVEALLDDWHGALDSITKSLALVDSVDGQLLKAKASVRLRRWAVTAEVFHALCDGASTDPKVKSLLPCWERVERHLDELVACDAAVEKTPSRVDARVCRALIEIRSGLWQSAAEDLAVIRSMTPIVQSARLIGIHLRAWTEEQNEGVNWSVVPWLASSADVGRLVRLIDRREEPWGDLIALERRLAAATTRQDEARGKALLCERALLTLACGYPRLAVQEAREVLARDPLCITACCVELKALVKEDCLLEAGHRVSEIRDAFEVANVPVPSVFWFCAGLVAQARGEHAVAVTEFSRWLEQQPDDAALRARARSLRLLKRFEEAERDEAEAEKINPSPASVKSGGDFR
ncbi:MAG: hypothetical protein QM790_09605 [Nibricoccus sp.]